MPRRHPKYCKHENRELDEIVNEVYCKDCMEALETHCIKCLEPKTKICERGQCE